MPWETAYMGGVGLLGSRNAFLLMVGHFILVFEKSTCAFIPHTSSSMTFLKVYTLCKEKRARIYTKMLSQ